MSSPRPLVQILLTPEEAGAIYRWLEDDDFAPKHWETPLRPVHEQLRTAGMEQEW